MLPARSISVLLLFLPPHPTYCAPIHQYRTLLPLLSKAVSLLLLLLHLFHLPIRPMAVIHEGMLPHLVVRLSRMPLPSMMPPFCSTLKHAKLVLHAPMRLHILWPIEMLLLGACPHSFLLWLSPSTCACHVTQRRFPQELQLPQPLLLNQWVLRLWHRHCLTLVPKMLFAFTNTSSTPHLGIVALSTVAMGPSVAPSWPLLRVCLQTLS